MGVLEERETWTPLLGCTGHLVYGALAGSVGLDVPGRAGLAWPGHSDGVHGGVHVGGDCPQPGGGARGAGALSGPGLDVGGGDDNQEAWVRAGSSRERSCLQVGEEQVVSQELEDLCPGFLPRACLLHSPPVTLYKESPHRDGLLAPGRPTGYLVYKAALAAMAVSVLSMLSHTGTLQMYKVANTVATLLVTWQGWGRQAHDQAFYTTSAS